MNDLFQSMCQIVDRVRELERENNALKSKLAEAKEVCFGLVTETDCYSIEEILSTAGITYSCENDEERVTLSVYGRTWVYWGDNENEVWRVKKELLAHLKEVRPLPER